MNIITNVVTHQENFLKAINKCKFPDNSKYYSEVFTFDNVEQAKQYSLIIKQYLANKDNRKFVLCVRHFDHVHLILNA